MSEETNDVKVEGKATEASSTKAQVNLPAFFGVKAGMTRIFTEEGKSLPATVIKLIPNVITQVKTKATDGYEAYQVSFGEKKEKSLTSPRKGQLKKANTDKFLAHSGEVKASSVNC